MAVLYSLLVVAMLVLGHVTMGHVTGVACGPDTPCTEGTSCHPTLEECVPDPPRLDRPSVFLGCDRNASDCAYFGFDYDGSYYHGNDQWCDGADNVRCVSKVAPPVPRPSSSHELHLGAYNVWERPFTITQDGQRERTCRIPRELAKGWPQLDVITFQETFMGGCWASQASMRQLMTQHGFPYHTTTVGVDDVNVVSGGIWIASRWPIVEEDQFVFKAVVIDTWDFFSSKGVSYAKIIKTVDGESRTYHVMGTHMQAGGGSEGHVVRQRQVAEWAEFVKNKSLPRDEAVLYGGDFNVHSVRNPDVLANVTRTLNTIVPPLLDDEPPVTPSSVETLGFAQDQIDYAMYSADHLTPTYAAQRFLNPEDDPFPICWCEVCPFPRGYVYPEVGFGCWKVEMREKLSDHRPIYGKFLF